MACPLLGIFWAVLDRASRGWRGLTMTPAGLRLLHDLRRSLLEPPRQVQPRPTPTHRISDRPEPASA
jgi:putative transposase